MKTLLIALLLIAGCKKKAPRYIMRGAPDYAVCSWPTRKVFTLHGTCIADGRQYTCLRSTTDYDDELVVVECAPKKFHIGIGLDR